MAIGTTAALIGSAVISAGMAAASSASQASAAGKADAYSAAVAGNNAQIARDNARDVELRGREAVYDQRRAVSRELGRVRAAAAGQGLAVDEVGTVPQDMVNAMAEAGELDIMRLRNNIEREKRRALVQASNYEAQQGQFEMQRASRKPGMRAFMAGATSLVNSASSPAGMDLLFG